MTHWTTARDIWRLCLDDRPRCSEVKQVRPPVASDDEGSRASALQSLTQSVTRAAIDSRAGTALMLHAGGLCDPTSGASIVYVAPGGTGKTTLTRVLGRGRGYPLDW